jgi:hypothetical protein
VQYNFCFFLQKLIQCLLCISWFLKQCCLLHNTETMEET